MTSPVWSESLAAWSDYMRASGLPETTINLRTYHLRAASRALLCDPHEVTTESLLRWLASQDWKPNTRRAYRSSLRAFYRWATLAGRVGRSPAHDLPPIRVPRPRPRPTPEADYLAALRDADPRAVLAILLTGSLGLRRGEAARARREDLEPDLIGWRLRVVGKGGHVRLVPVGDELAALILSCPEGWLFPSREGEHLTPHYLGKIISRHLPPGYATHSNRHRAGTQALRAAGGNLRTVQEFLGHADPRTTAIYTLVDDSDLRKAVEAITPPRDLFDG